MDHKAFEQEVRRVRMQCSDAIDDSGDRTCQKMMSQLQQLEDGAQTGKNVTTLHHLLKDMRRTAENLVDGEGMSHGDANKILNWVENAIQKTR